jgi:hypothetical protein
MYIRITQAVFILAIAAPAICQTRGDNGPVGSLPPVSNTEAQDARPNARPATNEISATAANQSPKCGCLQTCMNAKKIDVAKLGKQVEKVGANVSEAFSYLDEGKQPPFMKQLDKISTGCSIQKKTGKSGGKELGLEDVSLGGIKKCVGAVADSIDDVANFVKESVNENVDLLSSSVKSVPSDYLVFINACQSSCGLDDNEICDMSNIKIGVVGEPDVDAIQNQLTTEANKLKTDVVSSSGGAPNTPAPGGPKVQARLGQALPPVDSSQPIPGDADN